MERIAFKMKLFAGKEDEYKKRHDEIWPELSALLKESGVKDYSIFLDKDSLDLFGVLICDDLQRFRQIRDTPLMRKWWNYMKDIMDSNADGSPVSTPLEQVFYLP